jgi:hypothetical protein
VVLLGVQEVRDIGVEHLASNMAWRALFAPDRKRRVRGVHGERHLRTHRASSQTTQIRQPCGSSAAPAPG